MSHRIMRLLPCSKRWLAEILFATVVGGVMNGCTDLGSPPKESPSFCPTSLTRDYYYYYFFERKPLWLRKSEIAVQFASTKDSSGVAAFAATASPFLRTDSIGILAAELDSVRPVPWRIWRIMLVHDLTAEVIEELLARLRRFDDIIFAEASFETDSVRHLRVWCTNEFVVELVDSSSSNLNTLTELNRRFGLRQRRGRYRLFFYMEVPKSLCRTAREMSTYYLENYSHLFRLANTNWVIDFQR